MQKLGFRNRGVLNVPGLWVEEGAASGGMGGRGFSESLTAPSVLRGLPTGLSLLQRRAREAAVHEYVN